MWGNIIIHQMNYLRKSRYALLILLVIPTLIFLISIGMLIFTNKFILLLDLIVTPANIFTPNLFEMNIFYFMRDKIPSYLPLALLIQTTSSIIPMWVIEKIILLSIFVIPLYSIYKFIQIDSFYGKAYGYLLYILNPFVYVRLLSGQWFILLAYSLLPLALSSFINLLKDVSKRNLIKTLFLVTFIGIFNVHILFLFAIISLISLFLEVIRSRKKIVLKYMALLSILYILINSYWLIPVLTTKNINVAQISTYDIFAFAPKISAFNALFTTASMYGFWREGYVYAKDFIPYWYLLFFFILYLAIYGLISNYRNKKTEAYTKILGVTAIIAMILGAGVHGPFSSVFEYLFDNIFFFRGLRDSHKFVALIVLAYAYLGALGVAEFEKIARYEKSAHSIIRVKTILVSAVIILALITPFVYSLTMFNSFWGQIKSTDYPKDWYETNEFLNQDKQDFNVLFLPWHLYMDFHWVPNTNKRIVNPASSFFNKPVIQGENIEMGSIYSQSTNPTQRYIESLLSNRDKITNFGELIIPLNVKYVLLTKEVDYKKYSFLFNQTDLKLIKETENFYIFKNAHPVSRFYLSSSLPPSDPEEQSEFIKSLKPSDYTQLSPVKFSVNANAGYVVFVPPNLDSEWWELDGRTSTNKGLYAVYPAGSGMVYYTRFNTYLVGYFVSLVTLIGLIIWYYRKDDLDKMMNA
jgi:hypothetical protein